MSVRNYIAAPGLSRAVTAPHHRWPAHMYEEEDNSPSDSRRSEYRSMAGSRRSSRTSLSESLAETDATTSTSEEMPGKHVRPRRISQNPPPPPRVPKPPKSCKEAIYQEDVGVGHRERRPRLRREDTVLEEEERRRSRSKRRREELWYPKEREIERQEQRPKHQRNDLVYDDDSEQDPLPTPRRGEVIYEEDLEAPPTYNPFRDGPKTPSRSRSRPPLTRQSRHPSMGRDEHESRSRSKQRLANRYAFDVICVLEQQYNGVMLILYFQTNREVLRDGSCLSRQPPLVCAEGSHNGRVECDLIAERALFRQAVLNLPREFLWSRHPGASP